MAVQILKRATVRCSKLLLLFLFWNAVAAANGIGSEWSMLGEHNYPKAINEWNNLDVLKLGGIPTLLPAHQNYGNNNAFGNPIRTLNVDKRTPNGFIGMRGKKEYEFTDYSNANNFILDDENAGDFSIDPIQRAAYENALNNEYGRLEASELRFKKAPSTFYGVRGKKYAVSDSNRINSLMHRLEEDEKRKVLLQRVFDNWLEPKDLPESDLIKRAPTGFTGMRGKRPANSIIDYLYMNRDAIAPPSMGEEKRGPVSGFVGVRGKKDVDHQALKRSPAESVNQRSKARRFVDFTNKFVAVRGKKADANSDSSNTFTDETEQKYSVNNMPLMALLGVRGKRAIAKSAETEDAACELAVNNLRSMDM